MTSKAYQMKPLRVVQSFLGYRVVRRRVVRRVSRVRGTQDHYERHRESARAVINERLHHFATFYEVQYARVSIRNTSTRWGSCSSAGGLNFHYKIGLLPPSLMDYVIVHEVCHLIEMNHSRSFWVHVARTVPDYRQCRAALKQYALTGEW